MPDIPGNVMPVKTMVTDFGKASAAIGVNGVVVTAIRKILHMSVPILFPGTAVSWASHHMCVMPVTSKMVPSSKSLVCRQ